LHFQTPLFAGSTACYSTINIISEPFPSVSLSLWRPSILSRRPFSSYFGTNFPNSTLFYNIYTLLSVMAISWARFVAFLAASSSVLTLVEPIPLLDALLPKTNVEIDYANITGRINGNIKEFLSASRLTTCAWKYLARSMANFDIRHSVRYSWLLRAPTALY
jgi:hypothetical protein